MPSLQRRLGQRRCDATWHDADAFWERAVRGHAYGSAQMLVLRWHGLCPLPLLLKRVRSGRSIGNRLVHLADETHWRAVPRADAGHAQHVFEPFGRDVLDRSRRVMTSH